MRKIFSFVFLTLVLLPFGAQAATININTASAVQLDTLPGIGPSKAAAIIEYRTVHGPFIRVDDIQNVKGIGPSTYASLRPLITVGGVTVPTGGVSGVQPSAPPSSSNVQQAVTQATVPAKSTSVSTTAHETSAVSAPRATAEVAALGALTPLETSPPITKTGIPSSLWVYVFLGVVALAGGALLIL